MRQKKQVSIATAGENEVEQLEQEALWREELEENENDIQEVLSEIGLTHPITYDGYDICELTKAWALSRFTVKDLRPCATILSSHAGQLIENLIYFQKLQVLYRTVPARRYAALVGTPKLGRTPFAHCLFAMHE